MQSIDNLLLLLLRNSVSMSTKIGNNSAASVTKLCTFMHVVNMPQSMSKHSDEGNVGNGVVDEVVEVPAIRSSNCRLNSSTESTKLVAHHPEMTNWS
jgi:hypothetical protein